MSGWAARAIVQDLKRKFTTCRTSICHVVWLSGSEGTPTFNKISQQADLPVLLLIYYMKMESAQWVPVITWVAHLPSRFRRFGVSISQTRFIIWRSYYPPESQLRVACLGQTEMPKPSIVRCHITILWAELARQAARFR